MYTYEAKQFDSINGLEGLSPRLMSEHYKLYEGYVKKANEIQEKLSTTDTSTANATYSDLRALKLGFSFAVDAIKGHELFFSHLGGSATGPQDGMSKLIEKSFGNFESWLTDMKQTGIAARGWVWSAYDWDSKQLINVLGDGHDAFPIWNATPLVALDVYEHAYFIDYGVNRKDYIETFFKHLNWEVVEQRITDHQIQA
jgi:superoxide dismutase, Fe-Mn family